ncbi:RDD family protein [Mucilaginibacter sp.]|uniref:RDD family protein n=1 Tax=Mucilaginibacter sp. TaxID=1882438 RepID=UPI0025E603E6|nr:RDD family protein [Mucilaginibacter sp.]
MQTITVHTTQNIDIDYEIAGIGERILALLIDYGIFIALSIVGGILAINGLTEFGVSFYFIVVGVAFAFYDLVCEVFLNGQSLGKRILKIKVISLDGNRPTFSQYLLRWVLRFVDFPLTAYLGALVSAIVTDNGQRIGDIAAGTAMVKTHPRTQMNNLVFRPSDDTYVPVFKEVSQLTDDDINLIADVLHNYMRTRNSMIVYNMARRIMDHFQIALPPGMNDMQFLETIIKDYSHIVAQADML